MDTDIYQLYYSKAVNLVQYFKKRHKELPFLGFEENYKWDVLQKCKGKSNLEIAQILSKSPCNFLYMRCMITMADLIKTQAEALDVAIECLRDEKEQFAARFLNFKQRMDAICLQGQSHPSDERTAAAILTCINPQQYTFFMHDKVYVPYRQYLEAPLAKTENRYEHFLRLLRPLVDVVSQDTEIQQIFQTLSRDNESSNLLTAQTILWCMQNDWNIIKKTPMFTWIPFYQEVAEKLLKYRDNREELVRFIYADDGLAKYTNYLHMQDKSEKIDDIDPFSFFGIFNTSNKRNSKPENRIDILNRIKAKFEIAADVPSDFDGIPLLNYIRSFYFHWDRAHESCNFLWDEYEKLLHGDSVEKYFLEYSFATRKAELTMPLFWIRPYEYLALDSRNCLYLENEGVVDNIRDTIQNYEDYRHLLELAKQKMEAGEISAKTFPELSYAAWIDNNAKDSKSECQYFLAGYNFGYTDNQFDTFLGEGIWRGRGTKKVNALIESVHPGDVLMLKSAYTRGSKHNISVLKVSAVGVVKTNPVLLDDNFYEFSVDYIRTDDKEFTDFKGSYMQTFHLTTDNLFIDYANSYLNNMANTTVGKYQEYIDLLEANKNLILTGAPGTGKTYMAKQIAKEMMGITSDSDLTIVQFHPSFDYTDFVEGLRPVQQDGQIVFRREDGIFKSFCKSALTNLADAKKSQSELSAEEAARKVLSSFIADATADGTIFKTQSDKDFSIIDESNLSIQIHIPQNEKAHHISLSKKELLQLLVAKPKINNSGDVWEFFGKKYRTQQDTYMAVLYQEMRDKVEHVTVQTVKERKFVFIIDEINRGDLSKILGDLFYAIDPDYRGKDKCCVKTQYQNLVENDDDFIDGFYVPENVYILATMNDIDRSVESMDFAIRRRFAWKEVYAADTMDMLDGRLYADEAKQRLNALNDVIRKDETLGTAYQIGASFMLKLPLYKGDFEKLWKMHIEGTLKEYTRGMRNQAEKMEAFKKAYDLK